MKSRMRKRTDHLMHYLFYQHNVQQFFIRHIEKFTGIIVPLSIATSFPSGTYGFLRALLAKDRTKQFALDPRSALFQHNWNRANIREPHKRMAAVFGEPFTSVALNRPLIPRDITPDSLNRITQACIRFQLDFRVLKEEQRKLEKYRKLLGINTIPEIQNPQKLVPPYFQFDAVGDEWCELSLRSAEIGTSIVTPEQLNPIAHFTSWERVGNLGQLAARLSSAGITSFFLYPNNFREHDASESELKKYSETVTSISERGVRVEALHGGYFAILMSRRGLSGFGNGVGYGEWRDSAYHRGGTAEVRIYIPKLHRFLDPASAQSLLDRGGDYFTSDSDLLNEYAATKNPLTRVQSQEALDHFMECRQQEIDFVGTNNIETIRAEMLETVSLLKDIGELESERYGTSLQRWSSILAA
jgi:hypothetical protein